MSKHLFCGNKKNSIRNERREEVMCYEFTSGQLWVVDVRSCPVVCREAFVYFCDYVVFMDVFEKYYVKHLYSICDLLWQSHVSYNKYTSGWFKYN